MRYLDAAKHRYRESGASQVIVTLHERDISQIIFDIRHMGTAITDIDIRKPDLEDVFLQIARREHVTRES